MEDKEIQKQIQVLSSELKKQYWNQIDKFFEEHQKIMKQDKPMNERLEEIKVLIKQFSLEKNDETSREAQIHHKNNESPLARNRLIIKAELDQHLMNYDDNWDHNTEQANGKYTSKLKQEWEEKKATLEKELKDSVN